MKIDIICNVHLPPAIANTTDNLGMIVYVQNVKTYDYATKVTVQYSQSFHLKHLFNGDYERVAVQNLDRYSICVVLLEKSVNKNADLGNEDVVKSFLCTIVNLDPEIGVSIDVKPEFSLFIYLLCLLFISPIVLRYYLQSRKTTKMKDELSKKRHTKENIDEKRELSLEEINDEFDEDQTDELKDNIDVVVDSILKEAPWHIDTRKFI
ncbi:hypothetical protein ACOME3_008184 [Neoechinorhynchus agilis]